MTFQNNNLYQELLLKLNATLNYTELNNLLVEYLTEELDCNGFYLSFFDSLKKSLFVDFVKLPEKYKKMEPVLLHSKINLDKNSLHSECIRSKQYVYVHPENLKNYNDHIKDNFDFWNINFSVTIPIIFQKATSSYDPIGTLCLINQNQPFKTENINRITEILSLFYHPLKASLFIKQLNEEKEKLKNASEKNQKFLEIVGKINNLQDTKKIYQLILQSVISLFQFEMGLLFLEKNNFLELAAGTADKSSEAETSFNKISDFFKIEKGYEINLFDGATAVSFIRNNHFYFSDISQLRGLPMARKDKEGISLFDNPKSLLILPVLKNREPIGVAQFWNISTPMNLNNSDISLLRLLCSFIGSAIANSQTYTLVEKQKNMVQEKNAIIERKNKQLKDELKLAQKIQLNLIPSEPPELPGIKLASFYKPMEDVGGDFFDFIRLREPDTLGLYISDVSGHGVPAALITSMQKALLETAGINRVNPSELLHYINDNITDQTGGNFLTAFYGLYHLDTKVLNYSRAAHNFPYLIRDNRLSLLESKGPIIGAMKGLNFEKKSIQLKSGDKVIFYTDGLTEATNPKNDFFEDIIEAILIEYSKLPIKKMTEQLYHCLLDFREEFHFEDDICIVGLEIL